MRKPESCSKHVGKAFWELFFSIVYLSPSSCVTFSLIWLLEKCVALAPSIQQVLTGTGWEGVAKVASFFNFLSYFGEDGFIALFGYMIFAVIQVVFLLAAYSLTALKRRLAQSSYKPEHTVLAQVMGVGFLACSLVGTQIVISLLSYSVRSLLAPDVLPLPKSINARLFRSTSEAYTILVLSLIGLIELLLLSLINGLYGQDTSIRNVTAWSANTPFSTLMERVVHMYVHCDFIFGSFVLGFMRV